MFTPRPPTARPPAGHDTNRNGDASPLVDIILLKWMLAGVGIHIHVERLLNDTAYAHQALSEAEHCDSASARRAAARLRLRLNGLR